MSKIPATLGKFHFRNLHPQVFIGTASDRYSGWLGQIYSKDRYIGRITKRTKIIAGRSFTEEILPVDSVEEYFEHFPVLESDYTFYQLLKGQSATKNYLVFDDFSPKTLPPGDKITWGYLGGKTAKENRRCLKPICLLPNQDPKRKITTF